MNRKHYFRLFAIMVVLGASFLLFGQVTAQAPDGDEDGLPDTRDKCPTQFGPVENQGCPLVVDSDSDTVPDDQDLCPNTFGIGAYQGCPDTDEDGVPDNVDTCPNTFGDPQFNGCPPTVDSDGDTVPDDQDLCPNVFGLAEWNGCPDTDNDGLTTQYDNCPNVFGPRENQGCPVEPEFNMPTTGRCVVATISGVANVRALPTTDADDIGDLLPNTLYNVIGVSQQSDGLWYQLDNSGWAASYVLQTGGVCSGLPDTTPNTNTAPPAPVDTDGDGLLDGQDLCPTEAGVVENNGCPAETTSTPEVVIAEPNVDLNTPLANCPALVSDASSLPIYIQLDIANGNVGDPCTYVQDLLQDLVFGSDQPQLSEENINAILENCPQVLPALIAMMDRLYAVNPNAWTILDSVMTPDNACELAIAIASEQMPPTFGQALGSSATPTPTQLVFVSTNHSPVFVPASAAFVDAAIAICAPTLTPLRAINLRDRMLAAGVEDTDFLPTLCTPVSIFQWMGDISPAQQALIDLFVGECGMGLVESAQTVLFALYFLQTDVVKVLALDPAVICADIGTALSTNTITLPDPDISPNMAGCPAVAVNLQNYAGELSLYYLWIILNDASPCSVAYDFVETGSLGLGIVPPAPGCFNLVTNEVTLDGGIVINGASAWEHKIAVLSRPAGTVCSVIALDTPDTDGDGFKDDVDLCPADFSLLPDGCPPGGLNTPPTIDPIPDQTVGQGAFINVGVTAADVDGDPLTLSATSGDPATLGVSIAGNVITLTGVAVGTTTVQVDAFDGTDTTSINFNVEVTAPPPPNTPPAIGALPAQSLLVGDNLTVAVSVSDAESNPITLTASPADGSLATIVVNGTDLIITGQKSGSTQVTVIANDGMASSNIVFNLIVTSPAPPVQANPNPAPQVVVDKAVETGKIDPNAVEYGLLDFPGQQQDVDASAVFQATSADGLTSTLYMLIDSQVIPLVLDVNMNYYFPALDPKGKFAIFLSEDKAQPDNVALRILNVEKGISLPIFTGDPNANLKVGLYPVAWTPDGKQILLTLVDANNVPSIYALDMEDPLNIPAPTLIVENAATASISPNGRYIAFEQVGPAGQSNIFVALVGKPESVHPITLQPVGSNCTAPMFDTDSIGLFFTCELNGQSTVYRYGLQGVEALSLGIENPDNPAPGPGAGFVGFDDNQVIYYGYDNGQKIAPMIRLENMSVSHIRWLTLADLD